MIALNCARIIEASAISFAGIQLPEDAIKKSWSQYRQSSVLNSILLLTFNAQKI
jgi:hypothetical protein